MAITLMVNGRAMKVDVPTDMPLLWVLRDELNLEGTKYGCGMGWCGASTLHLGGEPVRSCVRTVASAMKAPITTLEGLSADGRHSESVKRFTRRR